MTETMKACDVEEVQRIIQEMDLPKKRTISAANHLSVKHALPNTCIHHTIIHENPCQERVLNMELDRIRHRKKQYTNVFEISRRTFLDRQSRKQRKWKHQDEVRIASMNFPTIRASAVDGRSSVQVLYSSPRYFETQGPTLHDGKPLLPYMVLRRERTEFVESNRKILFTKLPDVIETNMNKLQRYNTFCGDEMQKIYSKEMTTDKRFSLLTDALSPNKESPTKALNNKALYPKKADSYTSGDVWFMDDEDTSILGSANQKRGQSRESMRKATVVFPSVQRPSANSRLGLEREKTQYNIVVKNSSGPEKARVVAFPEVENNQEQVGEAVSTKSKEGISSAVRKGILKSPKKHIPDDQIDNKREKIKQDLKSKDLKELKDSYGQLKDVNGEKGNNPRESNSFHSPTMERRFSVKSATRS